MNGNGDRPKSTVRTELPPEFYPKEKLPGRINVAENTDTLGHHPQRSVEGLVFGGPAQESPAMPSTPQDLETGLRSSHHVFARAPPGLAPPHIAPQFYPGLSHHPSEPTATWPHPPYSMALPPEVVYTTGADFHSPVYPPVSGALQLPFPAPFSPQGGPVVLNGDAARSHSRSPTKSQYGEVDPGSNYGEDPQHSVHANGRASAKYAASEVYDVGKHIFNLFGNLEFTDYTLRILSPEAQLWSMPVHAAVVSRSPVIFEALRHGAPSSQFPVKDTKRIAEVLIDDRFVTAESLHEGIKILYAAPLLPVDVFLYNLGPYDGGHDQGYVFNEARKRMSQAISYAAAGRVLQIPEMQACGLRIAKSLLRWDTLDVALHFGLVANKTTVQPNGFGGDSRFVEAYASPLLDDALEFIAYNFPSDFSLYTIAPELRQMPRLPAVMEPRQPSHNPRLSKIRFGDAPPEDELKPSHITQLLSSILLSIPLVLLDRLFSHPAAANQVGWSGLVKMMRDVIGEREKRRQKVSKSQITHVETPRALLGNIYQEERVESTPDRPSGYKPVAVRVAERA